MFWRDIKVKLLLNTVSKLFHFMFPVLDEPQDFFIHFTFELLHECLRDWFQMRLLATQTLSVIHK